MVGEKNRKRNRSDGYKRKHDRNKFRKTTNATVHRKDLGNGLKGFLFSCTPHHENQSYRDGVLLLSKFCEDLINDPENESSKKKEQSLEEELNELKSPQGKLFTRIEPGVTGAVFLKINNDKIDIGSVVESLLREARQKGNPGSRHCIRLLPIYATCYAKAEDAAKAAEAVVKDHFPKIQDSPISYAIAFRSRLNNGAKRDDFIPAIASTVEKIEPRYKVNLTKPDVVLLVEVLKTSCCIGVFQHYYELAKMNLREAACPSKPTKPNMQEGSHATGSEKKTENEKETINCSNEKQNPAESDAVESANKQAENGSQTEEKKERGGEHETHLEQEEVVEVDNDAKQEKEQVDDQARDDAGEHVVKESQRTREDLNGSVDGPAGTVQELAKEDTQKSDLAEKNLKA